jgi:UDP-N-acetylmuramoylalanine--D-glutamate ligase
MDFLNNKKILLAGLGINNNQLARYLEKNKIPFDVIEKWDSLDELSGKFASYDVIFRTPGLPYASKPVQDALALGKVVYSQTKLFFDLCPCPIIGVTGTKGKGTTSALIAKILEADGKKTWLAGNIGRDPFEFLEQITKDDFVVLELSSFQLQDLHKSPHVAVVLGISRDHVDETKARQKAIHYSMDEYINAKAQVIKFQTSQDFAVLNKTLPKFFYDLGQGKKIISEPTAVEDFERRLPGRHNLENIAAAATVAKILDINEDVIRKTVAQFDPLPHRISKIREFNGITFIDDGYSTNIEPAMAAIDSFQSPVILIAGGFDKGLDYAKLGEKIKNTPNIKALVAIGAVAEKIVAGTTGFKGRILTGAANMQEIVGQARSLAESGDIILFSPGTSSFDMFKNEHHRADQFVAQVNSLKP